MRSHLLALLAAAAVASSGCVLTDYGAITPPLNKTTGVLGCASGSVFTTTVQTIVPQTQAMLYTQLDANGDALCGFTPQPMPSQRLVSRQDAMDWNFCLAAYAEVQEIDVRGGADDGTWILGGVSDLADGTVRLNTFHAPGVHDFSCPASGIDPGGPESSVVGDGFSENGAPPRLPGLRVEAIARDRDPLSCDYCRNVVAMRPERAADGFSSYWCVTGRARENRVRFTPSCRRDGPVMGLLSGQPMSMTIDGVEITARAWPDDRGIAAELLRLRAGGVTYEAKEPVRFHVDALDARQRIEVTPTLEEERRLARFALDAGLTDRPLAMGGMTEAGIELPKASVTISGDALSRFLARP